MSSLLPEKRPVDGPDSEPLVVEIDETAGGGVIDALSSSVARDVLRRLLQRPSTKSELTEAVGTSIQNVTYHVDNLHSAGIVDVVDKRYSAKGKTMDVYAAVSSPIVLTAGRYGVDDRIRRTDDDETVLSITGD